MSSSTSPAAASGGVAGTAGAGVGNGGDGKFHFAIDRGGTFTDVYCELPNGTSIVRKLLSEDPMHYPDAPTEGIRRILQEFDTTHVNAPNCYDRSLTNPIPISSIGSIRMGTTVATNALLERQGAKMALLITKGFEDVLEIGNQSRPNIFDLTCSQPGLLYETVIPVQERIILTQFIDENETNETNNNKNNHQHEFHNKVKYPRHIGITGEELIVIERPNLQQIRTDLEVLKSQGITSLAIALLHSYTYPQHEIDIATVAKSMNCFTHISISSSTMPMVKLVPRGHTCCAAAYLTPVLTTYLNSFCIGFENQFQSSKEEENKGEEEKNNNKVQLSFMKSDGGLAPMNEFGGHQAILSGPAGGVVGYAKTTYNPQAASTTTSTSTTSMPLKPPVIGFDMGGTSTDVSRYDGHHMEHVFETVTAGVAIQAPQLDIHTVAAGGGSRLYLDRGMFLVGPESAGAHPGPVCYRKPGGVLAVTDANVVLGRVVPDHFPHIFGPNEDEPLDVKGARDALQLLAQEHPDVAHGKTLEELALGFLQVANESMCRPIRNLTQMKGFDITTHILACFGGAGPQHACSMAKALGMKQVFIHRYGGILSAYGLSLADAVEEQQEPTAETYQPTTGISTTGKTRFEHLSTVAKQALMKQGYKEDEIIVERYLNMRYEGTDNAIMIAEDTTTSSSSSFYQFDQAFEALYQREFGFVLQGRELLIDDYRVRAVVLGQELALPPLPPLKGVPPNPLGTQKTYFETGWHDVPVYKMEALEPGHEIPGPAIIVQTISTIVVELDCHAIVTADGDLTISVETSTTNKKVMDEDDAAAIATPAAGDVVKPKVEEDPVQLSIFSHRFMGIAEQMGRTLQRTAISVNMKERLDFSCALFTKTGGLVANAPHIPVHLGAMQAAVKFQVDYWNSEGREGIQEGDVLVSNHPQLAGGSHLPDITVITPVFYKGEIIFFVASRGHHADIGGIAPGSMPPHSKCLEDEGAMIIAFKLVRDGVFQEQGITDVLEAPGQLPGNSGTRNLRDNLSDLRAQVAANNSGIRLLGELVNEYGLHVVEAYMMFIQHNAEVSVRNMLKEFAARHGTNKVSAVDYMDDGSPIKLSIDIDTETGSAVFDFTGTGPQVLGNHNAPPAVTYSAVIYSLRSLVAQSIPLNQGCLAPIKFIIPKYSLLNPSDDAGVVGGNVLTSQRVVDVVLRAFEACAASQGCMNNLTFGDKKFGYYETIAGGSGAGPTWAGRSGVHTHCTNTRITDPEILERRYPVLLREFSLRKGSGGPGRNRGGDGVIRELEPLRPLVMSILSERRTLHPYGMAGGDEGACGRNLLIRENGIIVNMGGRCSGNLNVGERLRIETPGGGGYGSVVAEEKEGESKMAA